MRKFLVTIILLVTMVLSNWAASSYNAMLPSTGRDFWLTYMYNYAQPATSVELQLYAIAEDATTITVTAADGTVLVAGQPIAAGAEFIYTIPSDLASKVYNTGTDITETKGLHVTSTSGDIALYMRNGYADGDLSYDMSPVFATTALGKEYMVQTWTRDMDRTEMAIVATEDGTQVTIVTGNEAQKNNGTTYSAGQTINLAMNAGRVYQLKGTTYNKTTGAGSLTGTTIQANKKVAVFNGGSKATIPHNTGANGDHLCEQSIPVEAWGKRFVLQEMNGFPGLEEEDVSSMPTEYYITAIYANTEVKVNSATKATLNKGESYKVTVKYTEFPKLVETSMPAICYGYMTNGATNNYEEETYGEPSMVLIPAIEKGVNKATLYAPKFDDPTATDIKHFANVTIASTGTSTMMLNGANVGSQFTTISGGLAYARLQLAEGINVLSNTECRFVAVAYDIEPDLAISEAYATTINLTSAAPKVYIDNELVDDGTELEWCNNHPGINFRAEIDYPHDSVRWTFGDGQSSTLTEEQHEYHLKVEGEKETNNVCLYVYHHTPLANEKKVDSVHVSLIVHPTYYFDEEVYTVCGKDNSFYWENGDTTFTFNKSTDQTITYKKNFGTFNYGCDSVYSLKLIVKPEVFGDTAANVCPPDLPYRWHGKEISTDGDTLKYTLKNKSGCDSIVTLTLHVLQPTSSEFRDTACVSYMWGTHKFTESCDYDSIFTNAAGCDSTVTLHLVIYNNETTDTTATACDSLRWHGIKYTTSGNYIWHGTTIHGCDSVVTLHLTINNSQYNRDPEATICTGESFVWHDHDYKNELTIGSQWLKWDGTTAEGCPRRDSIQVIVKPIQRDTTKDAICEGEQYTWRGHTYEKAITISDTVSCSEIYTLALTVNPKPTITNVVLSDDSTCYGIDKTINVTYSASSNAQTYEYTVYSQDSIPGMSLPPHPGLSPARANIITSVSGSGSVGTTPITVDVQSLPAGEYQFQIVVKSDCGCVSDTAYVSMTICKQPTITMTNPSPICGNLENINIPYTTTDAQSITYSFKRISDSQVIVPTKTESAATAGNIILTMPAEGLTPGDYRLTINTESQYGCRGEEKQMIIQVKETTVYEETDSICQGETYNWHGYTLTESCDTTYQPSCDVLYKLSLTVLKKTNMPVQKDSICAGNTYTWRGHDYTTAGTYTDIVYHEGTTCPKEVYTLELTVLTPVTATPVNVTICPNEEYYWDINKTIYTKAGTYNYTSKYANGCDSAYHTLKIAVRETTNATPQERTICEAELPYTWTVWPGHNLIFNEFGTKYDTARYQSGCDSVYYTLTLKGQKVDTTVITGNTCLGSTYTWDGGTIDADAVGTTTYYYTVPFAPAACPSKVLQLDLTVQEPQDPKVAKISACESYTWHSTTYNTSGKYEYTYKVGSCEITDTLYLTIGQPWVEKKDTTIRPQAAPFTWQGTTFTGVDVPGKQTKTLKLGTGKTACGCDSIREVTVVVSNKIVKDTTVTVCYGTPYNWRGEDRIETDTYTDDTNIDTTFILHLNALKTKEMPEQVKLCGESSYTWSVNGQTYTTSGEYEHTTKYQHFDCDSIQHVLKLTLGQPNTGTDNISVCAGDNVKWDGGSRIAEQGSDFTYTKTLTNASGCDSVVTVNVHVKRSEHITLPAVTICENELPYIWDGHEYTTSGNHTITYTNKEDCDSVVTLPLTIYPAYKNTINKELKEGETYQWFRGENGSRDTLVNTTGDWYDYQTTIHGCDSTTHLHVQYVEAERETVDRTACDSFEWGGKTYTKSGVYGDTTWSADHKYYTKIRYVNLTINESERHGYTAQTICEGDAVEMNGETYHPTTTGWLRVESTTDKGCLRIDSMYVTVKTVERKAAENIVICETERPYIWHDQNYNTDGTYQYIEKYSDGTCDSIIYTLNLTVKTVTPDQEFNEEACQQSTYNWTAANMSIDCRTYEPGVHTFYKDTTYAGECDVCHLTLNLTITSSDPIVSRDTTCQGYDYTWNVESGHSKLIHANQTCTEYYTVHREDCDRIYQLELTVLEHNTRPTEDTTICQKDLPFYWHGQTLTEAGIYKYTSHYPEPYEDCDSVYYTLNLKVQTIDTTSVTGKVCHGDHYTWIGGEIDSDTLTAGPHTYLYEVPALPGECTREVKKLSLLVNMPYETDTTAVECDSFTWHGKQYTTTGDYTWEGKSIHGCDSVVTMHLTIGHSFEDSRDTIVKPSQTPFYWEDFDQWFLNHTSGTKTIDKEYTTQDGICDSIYHLTVTVSDKEIVRTSDTICQGQTYTWHEQECTETKVYTFDTPDTLYYLNLLVRNYTTIEETYDLCGESEFQWEKNGKTYTTSGTHTDIAYYTDGCDSVHYTLHLTLGQPTSSTRTDVVCRGDYYEYNNTGEFVQSNFTYVEHLLNKAGCDSTITVNVQVNEPKATTLPAVSLCEDELPYIWDEREYRTTGEHQFTYKAANGCDSVVTLPLTVYPTTYIRLPNVEIYEGQSSFTWYRPLKTDTIINTNGTYYDHYTTVHGCDSTYELHVQVGNVKRDTISVIVCDSFKWGGHTYFESGRYGDTVWNGTIYTEIHYVELTINHSEREQHPEQTICEGETITWLGDTYAPTASQWLRKESTTAEDCPRIDSMFVTVKPIKTIKTDTTICQTELPLIWRGHSLDKDTVLTEQPTCDSIYTIDLKVSKVTPVQHEYMTKCQYSTVKWMGQTIPCQNLAPKTYEIKIDTLLPGECAKTQFVLHLTVTSSDPVVTYDTICYGDSYDWYIEGQLRMAGLTSSCIQHDTIHDEDCDRVYRLELEVREPVEPQVDDTVYLCALDEPIQWHGMTLSESGTYTFREEKTAQDGHCDNIYQITVVRTVLKQIDYTDHACEGDDYKWNDRTITAAELNLGVNHFYDTVPAVAPATCPTVVNHLTLTVTRPYTNVENVIACEEYTWRGRHYTESTTDTYFVPATETSCDSTFVLNLTIGHRFEEWDATTITEDQLPYTWHHSTFTDAGSMDETYRTATGCDSIWHLTLTVSERIPDTTRITICEGETYKWPYDNIVYNQSGIYSCTTMDKQPHLLYLTVNPTYAKDVYVEECEVSYNWHGTTYTESGDYTWTGATAAGCDSIETLHLTLLDRTPIVEYRTVCPGELVRWGDMSHIAIAGENIDLGRERYLNESGCYTVDTLYLTVREAVTGDTTATACDSFEWYGETYDKSGDYTWTGSTAAGCDSIVTLHLTINEPFYNEEDVQIHEDALPYRWTGHKGDMAISENGDYYDQFTTVDGCDSIYHLHLHIGFVTRDTAIVTECDSYEWYGTTYTESKLYTDTVWNEPTHETYDAIHYLNLTINKSVRVEEDTRQYCEGMSFEWKGQTYTLPAGDSTLVYETKTPEGCDSITTMHVTILPKFGHSEAATICWSELPYIWRGKTLNAAGTYNDTVQSMNGCDSILTFDLTVIEPATPGVEEEQEICLSNTYEWNGMSIHQTKVGEYTYYYRRFDENECDTITDVLKLTVKENDKDTIHDISCFGATYEWIVEDNITLFYGTPKTDVWHVDTVHHDLCDHVYVLDLKVMPDVVTETTDTTICEGSDYLWPINGQSYGKTGQYADTLRSGLSECDSVIRILNLKVRDVKRTPVDVELCEGSSYTFFGEEFTNLQVGTIEREHVEKYIGCDCDSAVTTLTLTIVPTLIDETKPIEACGEYIWTDVTPARTYENISGVPNAETRYINDTVITQEPGEQCATKHILHLTLKPTYEFTVDTIVRSLPVVYKGIKFDSPEATVTIDTIVTMKATTTCDSIYHITVVKTDKEIKNETATICEGETLNWRGDTYTTAGSYVNTTAHPDTVFNLELTVNPMTRHEAETVTTCDETYTWRGHTLTESTTCYDTVAGQGDACAEIYTLYLTMDKAEAISEADTICADMLPYTWAGRGTYSIAGTDTMLLSSYQMPCGETITDTMRVHVWPTAKSEEELTTCSNEPVIWNGKQYNTTGDYTWAGVTSHGCDSTATLHLTVLDAFVNDEYVEVAEGPYEWRGRLLTEDGVYADSLKKENGCDSIYSIRFHINIAERVSEDQAECGSYTWSQTGETYTESGAKTDTVWNAEHTNYTIYTLNLTIWPEYDYVADTDTASIKSGETYEWYENTYTISGDYTHMITTEHGCDSLLASLHLIVGDPIFNDIYEEACENEGFEFKGKTYTESTILYDSLKTEEGLDSINIIHLTIWPTVTHTLDTTVCEIFEWNGLTLTESCTQEIRFTSAVTGCDSIDRLILTITDSIILVPGNELIVDKLGYCPGDTAYIPYNLLKGNPTAYKLDFNPAAIAQGFVGHGYKPLNGHNDIPIAIPENCDAGTYEAILQLTDYVSESKKHTFRFTVAVDGVLHTMWNDVLAIDNSKGLFFGYRWYRDGELVQDAGKQYYNQNGEPLKGEYRAGLMLENGMWIYTCPLEVDMTNEPLSITAMPCPAAQGMPVTLTIHGADLETLADGILTVYSTSGQIVYRRNGAEHQQQVDLTAGQYIGVFRTDDNRSVNVKFLVY